MCDFSLASIKSRPAKIGDKLTTHEFCTGTRGFAASGDPTTAVCVLPGTELAFSKEVFLLAYGFSASEELTIRRTSAIFRQINKDEPRVDHDALEFADGRIVLLTTLCRGQEATVLQLPAQSKPAIEAETQKRVVYTD